jgi:hypothetical protein
MVPDSSTSNNTIGGQINQVTSDSISIKFEAYARKIRLFNTQKEYPHGIHDKSWNSLLFPFVQYAPTVQVV